MFVKAEKYKIIAKQYRREIQQLNDKIVEMGKEKEKIELD
jgi:hypothetical protein